MIKKAIILAGGKGTRLRPLTHEIPKPLIPVKKRPIINHLIDLFVAHDIESIALLVSREHEDDFVRWRRTWEQEAPLGRVEIFHEDEPRGTFGGLEVLRDWVGDNSFFVVNGDDLREFDLGQMMDVHEENEGIATVGLVRIDDATDKGVVEMEGENVVGFLEKMKEPPSNMISSGIYILDPAVFDYADFDKGYLMMEKDIFPRLARERKVFGHIIENGRWYDCDTLERWERTIHEW